MTHSLFVKFFDENGDSIASQEHHDLSHNDALKRSMGYLYRKGRLVGGVQIQIRTKDKLVYTATNPLPKPQYNYPQKILDTIRNL